VPQTAERGNAVTATNSVLRRSSSEKELFAVSSALSSGGLFFSFFLLLELVLLEGKKMALNEPAELNVLYTILP
jgi:hypothetical protein